MSFDPGPPLPPYWSFREYRQEVLDSLSKIDIVLRLDGEIANRTILGSRYQGPVDKNEWSKLETYYSDRFAAFVTERIEGLVETTPVERRRTEFDTFRKSILEINDALPVETTQSATTLPLPAEQLLLKEVRREGFDPERLEVDHIGRGGPLYLLELFVTAAKHDVERVLQADGGALTDSPTHSADDATSGIQPHLVQELIDEAQQLSEISENTEEIKDRLGYPVLMVDLWENQACGLQEWLKADREAILEMATATGKTVAGIGAIAYLCGELPGWKDQAAETDDAEIMVVAHSNAILSQWRQEIAEKLGFSVSAIADGDNTDPLHMTTGTVEFHTAHWLQERYERDLADCYDLIIYDEVHHLSREEGLGEAITRPNYDAALGLSATIREDEGQQRRRRLEELLAPIEFQYPLTQAIEDEIIPQFEWTVHPTTLDPTDQQEWQEKTNTITTLFQSIQGSPRTREILDELPALPFSELEHVGDFVQAHSAAEYGYDGELPDEWTRLHEAITSRTWIRHRSQPKIDRAVELAKEYLDQSDHMKIMMFAMDIDTTEEIEDRLDPHADTVHAVHSQVASSSSEKNRIVQQRINKFGRTNHGVLIAPKLLDEGIDVPDAEVGINVAGTKTKLQLVQRMGRILRKHGDQEPKFHHFVAVPDENYIEGLDSREYVQEVNWVRELGELIDKQPTFDKAAVDADVIERAERRGHEQWARDLLEDLDVETVQGSVDLETIINSLTADAAAEIQATISFDHEEVLEGEWQAAMETLRDDSETLGLSVQNRQHIWWLFPVYRDQPEELNRILAEIINTHNN